MRDKHMSTEEVIAILCVCAMSMSVVIAAIFYAVWEKNKRTPSPQASPSGSAIPQGKTTGAAVGGGKGSGGTTTLSNYWVAVEGQSYLLDCGSSGAKKSPSSAAGKEVMLGSAPGGKIHALKSKSGATLAMVDAYTWDACYCEGTCHVGGNTINLQKEGANPQFSKTSGVAWGIGPKDNKLFPFVSITADKKYKYGQKVYIDALDGFTLPTGEVHNGCVRVDDSCGDGCTANQIDFHTGVYSNYKAMAGKLREKVNASVKNECLIKSYKPQ